MEILSGLDALRSLPRGAVLTIGNYDGVHLGHRRILETCRNLARRSCAGQVAVITFEPHPLTVLRPEAAPPRLTPPSLKERELCLAGVNFLVVLPADASVLNLSAEEFWAILREDVAPAAIVEGEEFFFGRDRAGNSETLRRWATDAGIAVEVVPAVRVALTDLSLVRVSSSLVRWLLLNGRVRDAAICLGRPYVLEGEVTVGRRRGRTLGVPTANLRCTGQLIPADGVYVGRCAIADRAYPTAVSIGTMPTFNETVRTVEAHLVGFEGDLYGRTIQVSLIDWIREQRRFESVEALKARMAQDIEWTVRRQDLNPAAQIVSAETH